MSRTLCMNGFISQAVLACSLSTAFAAELHFVDQGDPTQFQSIQAAIDAASHGDEIRVAPGIYFSLDGSVINPHGKQITITGVPGETIIDGINARNCITCENGEGTATVFKDLTIRGGNGWMGGGGGAYLFSSGPLFEGCTFESNLSLYMGAAVYASNTGLLAPTFVDCAFDSNVCTEPGGTGGAVLIEGGAEFIRCSFDSNEASHGGAGYVLGMYGCSFTTCTFTENTAADRGGALRLAHAGVDVKGCTFTRNASVKGGAIAQWNTHLNLVNSTFSENEARDMGPVEWDLYRTGGAIHVSEGMLAGESCAFLGNRAGDGLPHERDKGGAIFLEEGARCEFADSHFRNNWSEQGGAISGDYDSDFRVEQLKLTQCAFNYNTADGIGGAIHGLFNEFDADEVEFSDNRAEKAGALHVACYDFARLDRVQASTNVSDSRNAVVKLAGSSGWAGQYAVTRSTFSWNVGGGLEVYSEPTDLWGILVDECEFRFNQGFGALVSGSTATISSCRFTSNNTEGIAGIHIAAGLSLYAIDSLVEDCVFLRNRGYRSGGLAASNYWGMAQELEVRDCWFEDNASENIGGGARVVDTSLKMTDTVFTGNSATLDGGGLDHSAYYLTDIVLSSSITGCEFMDNDAREEGGGLRLAGEVELTLENSSFRSNTARVGGGVINTMRGRMAVTNVTIQENQAQLGGGLATQLDSVTSIGASVICSNQPDQVIGDFIDEGGNTIMGICPNGPVADLNLDGSVDGADLTLLLAAWGPCGSSECAPDVNRDGAVDGADLTIVLSSWED